jgi:hypothetical protein
MAQASNTTRQKVTDADQSFVRSERLASSLTSSDVAGETDDSLANLWVSLKNLEDAIEETRKEIVEPEMENRVSPGEKLSGISHIQSHRKYVETPVGVVIGRAANRGIDYTDFVSLNASAIASDYPELASIGRNEYTYFR